MFTEKLGWVARLLVSKTYVVLTDHAAVVHIPLVNPNAFRSVLLLTAQTDSLHEFRDKLDLVIKEHDKQLIKLTKKGK